MRTAIFYPIIRKNRPKKEKNKADVLRDAEIRVEEKAVKVCDGFSDPSAWHSIHAPGVCESGLPMHPSNNHPFGLDYFCTICS